MQQIRFKIIHLFCFGLLLLWHGVALSCACITLVSSNSHFGMVHRIEAALYTQPAPKPKIIHVIADTIRTDAYFENQPGTCLIVTIGSEALATVLKTKTKLPILSVLTRKNTYHQLLREQQALHKNPTITAIYLDQPFARQLQLMECLLNPKDKRPIGILLGPNSLDDQEMIQQVAKDKNLPITTIYVNKFENPVAVLDTLLDEAKIVLAIPDNRIYNPKTSRGILLTAFHKRVPLIGYSRTYVNNGALAAVYSTTKQLAQQTAEQILVIIHSKDKKMPPPQYPEEFAIAVNYQVARSLGLAIDSEAALKQTMDHMENSHI